MKCSRIRCSVVQLVFCLPTTGPPDTPVVTTLQANTTSIFLSWEEPADNNAPILMYQITLQVVGDGSGNTSVFTSATTELTVTGLTSFTVYSVQVVAVNSIGSSPPSPLRTVMTAEGSKQTTYAYFSCQTICIQATVISLQYSCYSTYCTYVCIRHAYILLLFASKFSPCVQFPRLHWNCG